MRLVGKGKHDSGNPTNHWVPELTQAIKRPIQEECHKPTFLMYTYVITPYLYTG